MQLVFEGPLHREEQVVDLPDGLLAVRVGLHLRQLPVFFDDVEGRVQIVVQKLPGGLDVLGVLLKILEDPLREPGNLLHAVPDALLVDLILEKPHLFELLVAVIDRLLQYGRRDPIDAFQFRKLGIDLPGGKEEKSPRRPREAQQQGGQETRLKEREKGEKAHCPDKDGWYEALQMF